LPIVDWHLLALQIQVKRFIDSSPYRYRSLTLQVINVPHPTLRHTSRPLRRVDKKLKMMVAEMIELMYAHRGIGLAANQVDLPFQLFVIDPTGDKDSGQAQVFLNPVIQSPKGNSEAEEGCLSIPGVYGKVVRPAEVRVIAYDLQGNKFDEVVDGTMARVIQHEFDHLQGVIFPDRMTETSLRAIEGELEAFELEFQAMLRQDDGLATENVVKRLRELESEYCETTN